MNAKWIQSKRSMLVGLLGATVLFGSPISADADQGKWWNPERGAKRSTEGRGSTQGRRATEGRGSTEGRRATEGRTERRTERRVERRDVYRPPASRSHGTYRQGPRYSRPWQGRRIYRDRVWVRSDRVYRGRPAYGWRYYSRPYFYYPRHIIYVRPIRFFISAGAVIGGVHVHGSYSDADDVYGCNFCDSEFSSYHAYEAHVAHCPYAPRGYTVEASDWDHGQGNDDRWQDDSWQDDRGWDREDGE